MCGHTFRRKEPEWKPMGVDSDLCSSRKLAAQPLLFKKGTKTKKEHGLGKEIKTENQMRTKSQLLLPWILLHNISCVAGKWDPCHFVIVLQPTCPQYLQITSGMWEEVELQCSLGEGLVLFFFFCYIISTVLTFFCTLSLLPTEYILQ